MATGRKAVVVTTSELARLKSAPRGPTLVQLTDAEYKTLVRGATRAMSLPRHICGGVQITPIPGGHGYVAIPVCGPNEVPVIGHDGVIRCSPTASAPTIPSLTPDGRRISSLSKADIVKFLPCGLLLRYLGLCLGTCAAGKSCKKYVLQLAKGTYIYCYCG